MEEPQLVDLQDDEGGNDDSTLQRQLDAVESEIAGVEAEVTRLLSRQQALASHREALLQALQRAQLAPRADWHADTFEWDTRVQQLLADVFKLESFRPLQREVINATLQGRDVLCLMPSGGGKSLCFQLPAIVPEDGVTLVVSPLLSLISDQVLGLDKLGVPSAALTSHTPKEESNAILKAMGEARGAGGTARLVYVTPEKVVASKRLMAKLEKLYQAGRLSRIVVDEAHCCSAWGNDFRPDYKKLGVLRQQFPKVPIIALTATATHKVCEDLLSILRIHGAERFHHSINRPNLFYEVRQRQAGDLAALAAGIVEWVREHFGGGGSGSGSGGDAEQCAPTASGIVYCLTRKDCEQLAAELTCAGLPARYYHADMDPAPRDAAHRDWSAGRAPVMVATIAFGMGIHKADVRYVVHASISKSVENYYQESGRAGRDGQPARCLLFYRFADVMRQASIVCMEPTWSTNLMAMARYAAGRGACRRANIQRHFAEAPAACGGMCDVCARGGPEAREDVGAHAISVLKALQALPSAEKRATMIQLVDAWRSGKGGSDARAAKGMGREAAEGVVAAMALEGLLVFDFGFTAYATTTYLKASDAGRARLRAAEGGAAPPPLLMERAAEQACAGGEPGPTTQQQTQQAASRATGRTVEQRRSGAARLSRPSAQQPKQPLPPQQQHRGTSRGGGGGGAAGSGGGADDHTVVVLSDGDDDDFVMAGPSSKRAKQAG